MAVHVDSSSQTTTTVTINAVMQTTPNNKLPCSLRSTRTPTETSSPTKSTPSPIVSSPQPAPLPATLRPTTYASHHTATSWLSMPLTMATTAPSPPSKQPPAPQKQRHSLPAEPTTPQPGPKPFISHPELPIATAMSQSTTAAAPATSSPETTARAGSSTQMTATTSEPATHTPKSPR
jgi:hypothetical protein